jgi:hypothetical protein
MIINIDFCNGKERNYNNEKIKKEKKEKMTIMKKKRDKK